MKLFLILFTIWNIFTFSLYGVDKMLAKREKRRVSEANLLWCAFVMGGTGALIGQKAFRHKTQKTKFNVLLPIAFVINMILLALIIAVFKGII